jgi:pilus assembly protein CpaB
MAINPKIAAKLKSPLSLLLLATALAAGVAAIAYMYLQKREETMKSELAAKSRKAAAPMISVVVPKTDVGINTPLNNINFVSRPIESDLVYPDTLLAKDFAQMGGLKLARPVLRGRPVRTSDLQQPVVNDVASILPLGSRAMTIDIDNLNSIAQTLRPHHRVDIFLLSKAPKPTTGAGTIQVDEKTLEQATLFMQDMVVLATGKEFQDVNKSAEETAKMVRPGEVDGAREDGFDSITLLVKPHEAAKLMVGQKMGTFRVVLRGTTDRDALALRPLTAGELMPGRRARDQGIEFIVGGRGDNVISRLAVPPSQVPALQASLANVAASDVNLAPAQPPVVRGGK